MYNGIRNKQNGTAGRRKNRMTYYSKYREMMRLVISTLSDEQLSKLIAGAPEIRNIYKRIYDDRSFRTSGYDDATAALISELTMEKADRAYRAQFSPAWTLADTLREKLTA